MTKHRSSVFFGPTCEATRFAEEHCCKADESTLDAHRRACRSHSSNGRDPLESSEGPQGKKRVKGWAMPPFPWYDDMSVPDENAEHAIGYPANTHIKLCVWEETIFLAGDLQTSLMFDDYHYDWSLKCVNQIYEVDILILHISVY